MNENSLFIDFYKKKNIYSTLTTNNKLNDSFEGMEGIGKLVRIEKK